MKTLSERLIHAMKLANVKQVDLAKAAGVSRASVNDWISGKSQNIRGENLVKVAKLLNVNSSWLATGHGKFDSKWPFKNIQPEDFDVLSEEFITFLEEMISLQVSKQKTQEDKKVS
ncbi:helix-turn-helix domain-containing protein [Oligella urethralis]|uniref:Transcriptional repressor DicA n=1 Tax=Oligella urethralis TaxID=90245 RepID=A0A2N6QF52_9BURK|nr:helix-turn-helix transcriptional regulator [Oligella urethralis]PMC18208.1 XRE family transcriptional regulator [Oligella urethralis]SPY09125.1 transcriptional repressor DicA [Oligella urethralis]